MHSLERIVTETQSEVFLLPGLFFSENRETGFWDTGEKGLKPKDFCR